MLAATNALVWVAIGIAGALWLGSEVIARISKRRDELRSIGETWGQPLRRDRSERPLDRWYRANLDRTTTGYELDDQTFADLELTEVFHWADRTLTAIGAQVLYAWLRRPQLDAQAVGRRLRLAETTTADPDRRVALQQVLTGPGDREGWDAAVVLQDPGPELPGAPWMYTVLSVAFVPALAAGVLGSNIVLLSLGLLLAAANPLLHFVVANKTAGHLGGLRSVATLVGVGQQLRRRLPDPAAALFEGLDDDLAVASGALTVRRDAGPVGGSTLGGLGDSIGEYFRAFFLLDVRRYLHTRAGVLAHGETITRVLNFVGEVDAGISLEQLRRSEDGLCNATMDEGLGPAIEASGVVHPTLLRDGVANDIELGPRSLLVTGSNMAGKSTFLRTVGGNLVLAQSLGIACAKAWRHRSVRVIVSMQAHDDLGGSVSLYQAEVLRIRTILREGERSPPCLVLLDEVFRGTNPTDRVAASAAVLLELAERNVVVAATHDLALVHMTDAHYDVGHFTERASDEGDSVVFDYELRPGISRRTNALALLRRLDYPARVVERARRFAEGHDDAVARSAPALAAADAAELSG